MSKRDIDRPILFVTVSPEASSDGARLREALADIAEKDSTVVFETRPAEEGRVVLAGMSELLLASICDRLRDEYKIKFAVSEPRVNYLETIQTPAEAEGKYIRQIGGTGNYGHCKLRVEPNEADKGYEFITDINGGDIPREYVDAIDQGVRGAMGQGILAGFPVVDVKVTLFGGSYHDADSNEMAFRFAGSIAFKEAARKASPVLLEPIMEIQVELPEGSMGAVVEDVNSRRGRIKGMDHADGWLVVKALVPLSDMLSSSIHGCSEYPMRFAGYEAVRGDGLPGENDPAVTANKPRFPKLGRGSAAADPYAE